MTIADIYFAQIREDSLVERAVIKKTNPLQILCIGSGGCTAFSILNDGVQQVVCADNNAAQCALIELKKAGIQKLDRSAFLAFIGEMPSQERIEIFCSLQHLLTDPARKFWLQNLHLIEKGINKCGATELFYEFVSQALLQYTHDERVWRSLFECSSSEEQQAFYDKYFRNEKWETAIRILLSKQMHLQFFPPFMFAQSATNDFSSFFMQQFEKEIITKPVRNNYFLSQFIFGKYLLSEKEGMPYHLSEEGYLQAKRNIHKLQIVNSDIKTVCENHANTDCFLLSNVFDWCRPEQRSALCESIERSKAQGASLLYRTMLVNVDISNHFNHPVKYDAAFSAQLNAMERSMMYNAISYLQL